jgi:hypothetical protein
MRIAVPAVLLAGLVGLTGCVSPPGYGPAQPAAPAPGAAQPAAPPPAPAQPAGPVTGFTGDLRTLLLPRPSAATNAADPKSDGTITIEQAAASFGDANQGLTQLKALGFERGAFEQWREPDGTQVSIIVFQFGDHPSATTFTYGAQNSYALNRAFDAPIGIPGIPLGNAYQLSAAGPDKQWLTEVFFTRNNITAELSIIGPTKLPSARAVSLAQSQYGRLP